MQYEGKELIKVDGDQFPCCKRYWFYAMHSFKCRQTNKINEDTDIPYAEMPKLKES